MSIVSTTKAAAQAARLIALSAIRVFTTGEPSYQFLAMGQVVPSVYDGQEDETGERAFSSLWAVRAQAAIPPPLVPPLTLLLAIGVLGLVAALLIRRYTPIEVPAWAFYGTCFAALAAGLLPGVHQVGTRREDVVTTSTKCRD